MTKGSIDQNNAGGHRPQPVDVGIQLTESLHPLPAPAECSPQYSSSQSPITNDDSNRCWYFGVGEAVGWFLGTLVIHLSTAIVAIVVIVLSTTIRTGSSSGVVTDSATMRIVMTGEMLVFVMASLVAYSWRYRGRVFQELNLSYPDLRHVALVIGGTLPLSYTVSAWSILVQFGWKYAVQKLPWLEFVNGLNSLGMIKETARTTSLPLTLFILAVLPAIGEEVVFRGAIGRILIAHLGVGFGIGLTSFLFGCIHIHPVHAIAVMPLGLAIHLIYLWTRSFWLPMLLHFLNNSWATLSARIESEDSIVDSSAPTFFECMEMSTAVIGVIFLGIALRQSRIRYMKADGNEWSSPRFPIRRPDSTEIQPISEPMNSLSITTAVIFVIACHLTLAFDLVSSSIHAR